MNNMPAQYEQESWWSWFLSIGHGYFLLTIAIGVLLLAMWRSPPPPLPRFANGEMVSIVGTNHLGQVRGARCPEGWSECEYSVRVDLTTHGFFERELRPMAK